MTIRRFLLGLLVLLVQLGTAEAQVTTRSRPAPMTPTTPIVQTAACAVIAAPNPLVVPPTATCACRPRPASGAPTCARPQDELSRLVDFATTAELVAYLNRLATVARPPIAGNDIIWRFVWSGTAPDGTPLARKVMYQDGETSLLDNTLPGLHTTATTPTRKLRFFDVLVLFDAAGDTAPASLPRLESFYTSSKKQSPVLEQVPALVGKLGILEALAARGGVTFALPPPAPARAAPPAGLPAPPPPPPPRVVLKLYAPELPFRRAGIGVRDWIITTPTPEIIAEEATGLQQELGPAVGRTSTCAATLAMRYAAAIQSAATQAPCAGDIGLFSTGAAMCTTHLNRALNTAFTGLIGQPACPPDAGSVGEDLVATVDTSFRSLVKSLGGSAVKGESQLENKPREHFSFGLLTAVRTGRARFQGVRATVGNDDKVTEDPLPRLVNAVIVNWHPWGYDDSVLVTVKDPGSIKVFGGTTLSPDFGMIGGLAYSPLKGLSFNVGYAVMLTNVPAEHVTLGEAVPAAQREDPFSTGRARTWVWGLSYSFQ